MAKHLRIAIDGSNISSGGGLTHLAQLLTAVEPLAHGVDSIHLWTSRKTAEKLPKRDWLVLHTPSWCDGGLLRRMLAQQCQLPVMIKLAACDVLFSPGGTLPFRCPIPMVTMSQNMLPFEPEQAALFGRWSLIRLKMFLLSLSQGYSFILARGVIFLTKYALDAVSEKLADMAADKKVIPHGIERRFVMRPRPQRPLHSFTEKPLRLLYVSIQLPYKHHVELIQAVAHLRRIGLSVVLQMVGDNTGVYGDEVRRLRLKLDPHQAFLHDLGHVDFQRLHELYSKADVFVFASSCENLPNILIEAMAAGLPIACSNRGPMSEVLADAGLYFKPESPDSIAQVILGLANDPDLRADLAQRAWERAQAYSWERCARETLDFVTQVALRYQ